MDRFTLDMTLDVLEGAVHDLGTVTLWCRLRANTYNPGQLQPHLLTVARTASQWSPPVVSEPAIRTAQVALLVDQLHALHWPGRHLALTARATPLAGTQAVRLQVTLNGRVGDVTLHLHYGGMTGPDAEGFQTLIRTLLALGSLPPQEHWLRGTWP